MLDALREPRYRRLWLSGLCAHATRWLDFLVLGWVVLELTDSPFLVGLAAFCRTAPMLALGPLAGVVADRFHGGRVMIAVQAINAAAAVTLAVLFGTGRGSFGALVLLEMLLGVAWAIDFPARRTMLYTLVGPGRLTNAVSLESVSMQATKMLGPLLGGVLLARVGPVACYAALALLSFAALALVTTLSRQLPRPAPRAAESVARSLADGLRDAWSNRLIRGVLAITVCMNALVFPYQHMLPIFARDVHRVGPELLGLLIAVDGLGALTGALVIAGRRGFTPHRQLFTGGSLAAASLVVAFALSPWYLLSLPTQFLIGIGQSGFSTMQSTIVLLSASEQTRGRVMGILSACIGTQPFGALWIGFFASHAGAPWATATGATLALVLMLPVAKRMGRGEATPA